MVFLIEYITVMQMFCLIQVSEPRDSFEFFDSLPHEELMKRWLEQLQVMGVTIPPEPHTEPEQEAQNGPQVFLPLAQHCG